MLQSLKEYIKLKSGLKQNQQELKNLEQRLNARFDFLAAFMNLTWPERLEIDPIVLQAALSRLTEEYSVQDFKTSVHKNDLMFGFHINRHKYDLPEAVYSYFRVGADTAQNLRKITSEAEIEPGKILDFGSGYGRVSRFLPAVFPDAEVEVSEVKKQAMQFQEREFGFKGITHNQEAESFPDTQYDLILALSVFTHLPRHSFENWLTKMMSSLKTGGALVFSFLDQSAEDTAPIMTRSTDERGDFVYIDRSEDKHFAFVADSIKDDEDYGSSFVTRDYITRFLDNNSASIRFLDRQLVKAQDAVLVIK